MGYFFELFLDEKKLEFSISKRFTQVFFKKYLKNFRKIYYANRTFENWDF